MLQSEKGTSPVIPSRGGRLIKGGGIKRAAAASEYWTKKKDNNNKFAAAKEAANAQLGDLAPLIAATGY